MTKLEIKEMLCNKLISIWTIQDALLQAYRSIYITSISILYAFAVVLLILPLGTKIPGLPLSITWLGIAIGVIGIFIFFQWIMVTDKRGHDVKFIQNQLMYCEKKQQIVIIDVDTNKLVKPDLVEINADMEIPIVTTFKNFENMNLDKQKKILSDYNIGSEVLISKETNDISTRETLQRRFPFFWGILWAFLVILNIVRIFGEITGCSF
ncbi:hypothetical protein HZA55_07580 [Candidatus Poribacteria bacterium]|nr:hypothetical protein [Candidatus Poribacteria bacterium]